ncbi:hypothetical protein LSAT2_009728 [Lamellibrachia satsuma]|nr:hypothetical protein LSAT2_009728 [Lamellibrachia satsuma]
MQISLTDVLVLGHEQTGGYVGAVLLCRCVAVPRLRRGHDHDAAMPAIENPWLTNTIGLHCVGARCRFDSTSATRETCIFPCRCAKGCDQVSGQCLDDGQCKDGYPSGYNWRGTACQIGNVALYKTTTHSTGKWGDMYPSSQAVDGAIDPLSYKHCAVPNAMLGTDVWWKVDFGGNYRISRVIIYNSDTVVDAPQCPAIDMRGRDRCGAAGISELDCQVRGCCWDGEARGSDIACYRKQCKAGYFGWRCRFKCHKCSTCDSVTGKCPTTCQDDRWGVGCMLRSRAAAKNYCRNPDNGRSPWCFYYGGTILQWTYCNVNACEAVHQVPGQAPLLGPGFYVASKLVVETPRSQVSIITNYWTTFSGVRSSNV